MNNNDVYKRIKETRLKMGLSQQELADRCGYTAKGTISMVERGKHDISQSRLEKIANALNVTPTYLLTGIKDNNSSNNSNNKKISKEEYNLITMFRELSPKQQKKVMFDIRYELDEDNEITVEID